MIIVSVEAQDEPGILTRVERKFYYERASSDRLNLPISGAATALAIIVLAWVLFGGWFSSVSLKLTTDRPTLAARAGLSTHERLLITYTLSQRARTTLQVVDGTGTVITTLRPPAPRRPGE